MFDSEINDLTLKLANHFGFKVIVRFTNGNGAAGGDLFGHGIEGARWRKEYGITYGRKGNGFFPNGAPTLIHEFAHCLDRFRPSWDKKRPHGIKFYMALIDSIKAANLYSLEQHPWEYEYHSVYMNAKRAGLTNKEWKKHEFRRLNRLAAINRASKEKA